MEQLISVGLAVGLTAWIKDLINHLLKPKKASAVRPYALPIVCIILSIATYYTSKYGVPEYIEVMAITLSASGYYKIVKE